MRPPGYRLGAFDVVEQIGAGAMGVVWRGTHVGTGRDVALKMLPAHREHTRRQLSAFQTEIRAIASVAHPSIVEVFDHGFLPHALVGFPQGTPWFAMELATGSLAPPSSWEGLRRVLVHLLDGLAHAHARGVIHLDLKPENVLDVGERHKLADFGLAHLRHAEMDAGSVRGSPSYMAPEQFRGDWRGFGPWTDLYALGCVAIHLASGRPPFVADTLPKLRAAHLSKQIPVFETVFSVPAGFRPWVRSLLRKDPERRFQRSADAAYALGSLAEPEVGSESSIHRSASPYSGSHTLAATFESAWLADDRPPPDVQTYSEPEAPPATPAPLPARWIPSSRRADLPGTGLGLVGMRQAPLVGRGALQERLWGLLAEVHRTQTTRVIVVSGASGVGKSKLAEWLCTRAHEVGGAEFAVATHGPAPAPGDGLGGLLARSTQCVGLDDGETLRRVEARLKRRGVTTGWEWRALASLFMRVPLIEFSSPKERFSLIERHLGRMGEDRPVVLWLDDLQWGEDAARLAHRLLDRSLPVLVIGTHRSDVEGCVSIDRLPNVVRIEPLAQAAQYELLDALCHLEPALQRDIVERTQGNPQFTVQLVDDWIQRGILAYTSRGWTLVEGAQTELPLHLEAVWRDRANRLLERRSPADRSALELAALLGDRVDRTLWRGACAAAQLSPADDLMDTVVKQGLATPQLDDGWRWGHGMFRETLAKLARQGGRAERLHRACAESLLESRDTEGIERRGMHWLGASQPSLAVRDLLCVARRRVSEGDLRKTERLLNLTEPVASGAQLCEHWLLRGLIHRKRGEHRQALVQLQRVLDDRDCAEGLVQEALIFVGGTHWALGDLATAEPLLVEAKKRIECADPERRAMACACTLANIYVTQGRLEDAQAALEWGLDRPTTGLEKTHAEVCRMLAVVSINAGRLDEAMEHVERSLALCRSANARSTEAYLLSDRAEIFRMRRDLDKAADGYRVSAKIFDELGLDGACVPSVNLAMILVKRCQWNEARAAFLDLLQRTSRRQLVGLSQLGLAVCAAGCGDWEGWDHQFALAQRSLRGSALLDAAILCEQGGTLAGIDRPSQSAAAREYAALVYETLGRKEDVERLQGR